MREGNIHRMKYVLILILILKYSNIDISFSNEN